MNAELEANSREVFAVRLSLGRSRAQAIQDTVEIAQLDGTTEREVLKVIVSAQAVQAMADGLDRFCNKF